MAGFWAKAAAESTADAVGKSYLQEASFAHMTEAKP